MIDLLSAITTRIADFKKILIVVGLAEEGKSMLINWLLGAQYTQIKETSPKDPKSDVIYLQISKFKCLDLNEDDQQSCFNQVALDEARDYLIIELVDLELIVNPFVRALNLFHLGFLLSQTKINPRFLVVLRYTQDMQLLQGSIDSLF